MVGYLCKILKLSQLSYCTRLKSACFMLLNNPSFVVLGNDTWFKIIYFLCWVCLCLEMILLYPCIENLWKVLTYFLLYISCEHTFATLAWFENYFLPTASKKQWFHISQNGSQSTAFLFIAKRGYNNKKAFAGGILPIKYNNTLKQILKVEIYEFVFLCQSMYFHMLTSKCRLSTKPLIIKTAAVKSKSRILACDMMSLSCDFGGGFFFLIQFYFPYYFSLSKIFISLFLHISFSGALRPKMLLFCPLFLQKINVSFRE